MSQSYLIPGVDLLSLECLTAADVQQAIAAAIIRSPYGLIVVQADAPDVVSTTELARFVWLRTLAGVPTGEFYYYNGSAWVLLSIIDGDALSDHSVSLVKLDITGANALDIIRVNAGNTTLEFVSILNAIQNGTLTLNKLIPGGAAHVLVSLGNVNQFIAMAGLTAYFTDGTINISKITPGPASPHGLFLRTFEAGTPVEWADFDPNEQIDDGELNIIKLNPTGYGATQVIGRNNANTAWEPRSISAQAPLTFCQFLDEVGSGVASQSFVYGSWQNKRLNTSTDPNSLIVLLGGNQFILLPGTYRVSGYSSMQQCSVRTRIYNVTSASPLLQGVQFSMLNNDTGIATIDGLITVAIGQTLAYQYRATNNGLGSPFHMCEALTTGESEMYAQLSFMKIA